MKAIKTLFLLLVQTCIAFINNSQNFLVQTRQKILFCVQVFTQYTNLQFKNKRIHPLKKISFLEYFAEERQQLKSSHEVSSLNSEVQSKGRESMNLPKRVKRYLRIQNEDLALSEQIGFHIFTSAFCFLRNSWSYESESQQNLTRLPNSLELRLTPYHLNIGQVVFKSQDTVKPRLYYKFFA